ncbi:MAG: peptidoglycan DD-metalloendopeptidase family protein [Marinicella sp.]
MQLTFSPLLILALMLVIAPTCWSKKYYKHVDENGITHYSDKPPKNTDDFESWQVRPEDSEYEVKVINRGTKQSPIFYAINSYHGPVEIALDFANKTNVRAKPKWPARYVVPANSDMYLATIKPISRYQSWSFQYTIESTLGDPNAKHNSKHIYRMPFVGSKHYYISQGFNGEFSHFGDQNQYALDIVMPEGSAVLAARGGVVMDIAEDFYDGGVDAKKLHRGNYIRILHDDGSMAIYAHLQLESVVVARGQKVDAMQKIALSGNTGFTSGPHLHFAIQVNDGLRLKSVPFVMQHKDGQAKTPKIGPI